MSKPLLNQTFTVAGIIVYIAFFIRFVVRAIKRIKNGEIANRKLTFKKRWLIVPLLFIADLIYSYVAVSLISNTSFEKAVLNSPGSLTLALIALWVMLVCSLCVFVVRILGLAPTKKQKILRD